jgi:FixJ family two-component response regulator
MKSNVPGTAKEIIESLVMHGGFSVKQIAYNLNITSKTVYRIRKGLTPHPRVHLNLLQLYLSTREPVQN